jgi:hypothetical protein
MSLTTGMASEDSQYETMEHELKLVRMEQAALPPLVKEVQEALQAETDAFQRKQAGAWSDMGAEGCT